MYGGVGWDGSWDGVRSRAPLIIGFQAAIPTHTLSLCWELFLAFVNTFCLFSFVFRICPSLESWIKFYNQVYIFAGFCSSLCDWRKQLNISNVNCYARKLPSIYLIIWSGVWWGISYRRPLFTLVSFPTRWSLYISVMVTSQHPDNTKKRDIDTDTSVGRVSAYYTIGPMIIE